MRVLSVSFLFLSMVHFISIPSFPSLAAAEQSLSAKERTELQTRFRNLYDELDLLVRNERADQSDLKRQKMEFEGLKVFERIPFDENLEKLRTELKESASEKGVQFLDAELTGRSAPGPQPPAEVFTDEPRYQLTAAQLAETLELKIRARGDEAKIKQWMSSWADEQMRLVEPDGASTALRHAKDGAWIIAAHAFRFRKVDFPRLRPRNPMELLPAWAKKNPDKFAAQEPQLWEQIKKIQGLAPKAEPLYETRRQFILDGSRMSFYIKKTSSSSSTGQSSHSHSHSHQ